MSGSQHCVSGGSHQPPYNTRHARQRVQVDDETMEAVEALASRTGKSFKQLTDEAFADLLNKHKQPVGPKVALCRKAFPFGIAWKWPRS